MEIILMIRKMLEITGITPNDSIFCTVVRIAMPLNLVYLNVTTACFVLFEGDNFGDITKALSGVVMYFYVLCVYIIFLILRQSVFGMLEMLADKIEEREQLGSGNLYKEVNEKIDKITNTVGVVMYGIVLPSFLVPPMILSFYLYFARGAGKSAFILVFPTSLPYEWRTPVPYFFTVIADSIEFYVNFTVYSCNCLLFYAVCQFLEAFTIDIAHCLTRLDEEMQKYAQFASQNRSYGHLKEMLHDIIRFHMELKHLTNRIRAIYNVFFMEFFLLGMGLWCLNLLELHVGLRTNDQLLIVSSLSCISVFMPYFFVICNIGENVTTAFDSMNASIYDITWYTSPVELQKYMLPMLQITEEPIRIPVFASIGCCRSTFKEVINTGYTCFMMLRRLN